MAEGAQRQTKPSQICSICLGDFTDPRLLNCFHTFCLQCLQKYVKVNSKNGVFPCPLCRMDITIPEKGVTSFQVNFYIDTSGVTSQTSVPQCQVCDCRPVTSKCLNCGEILCDACSNCHRKFKATSSHSVIEISDDDIILASQKTIFCQRHAKEQVKYLCISCNMFICMVCKLGHHDNHECQEIKDIAASSRSGICKVIDRIKSNIALLDKRIEDVDKCNMNLDADVDSARYSVDDRIMILRREVETIGKIKMEELDDLCNSERERLIEAKRRLEDARKTQNGFLLTLEDVLELGSDSEILAMTKRLQTTQNLCSLTNSQLDFTSPRITFHPAHTEMTSLIGEFDVTSHTICTSIVPISMGILINMHFKISFPVPRWPYSAVPVSCGGGWIVCGATKKLQKFNMDGIISREVEMPNTVDDICLGFRGHMLSTSRNNYKIWEIDEFYRTKQLTILPHIVRGICKYSDGYVVSGPTVISILTKQGQVRRTISHAEFKDLDRVHWSEKNCTLYVCDDNVVFMLNIMGEILNTYKSADGDFRPKSVCTDSHGNIFIADGGKKCVHMLDKNGQVMQRLFSDQCDVMTPQCVAIDHQGCLWVGDIKRKAIRIYEYLS